MQAIAQACEKFYCKPGQSWKNVISLGDSEFEIAGTQAVVQRWARKYRRCHQQLPRMKTVKFLQAPSFDELVWQLQVVLMLIPKLTMLDHSVCVDLEGARGDVDVERAVGSLSDMLK